MGLTALGDLVQCGNGHRRQGRMMHIRIGNECTYLRICREFCSYCRLHGHVAEELLVAAPEVSVAQRLTLFEEDYELVVSVISPGQAHTKVNRQLVSCSLVVAGAGDRTSLPWQKEECSCISFMAQYTLEN